MKTSELIKLIELDEYDVRVYVRVAEHGYASGCWLSLESTRELLSDLSHWGEINTNAQLVDDILYIGGVS